MKHTEEIKYRLSGEIKITATQEILRWWGELAEGQEQAGTCIYDFYGIWTYRELGVESLY